MNPRAHHQRAQDHGSQGAQRARAASARHGGRARPGRRGTRSAVDLRRDGVPAPSALRVTASHVRVGDGGYAATFAAVGFPAEVGPAWLDPLLSHPGRVDVAVHIEPIPPALAAPMLRRQRARLESTRRLDADAGRLGDPVVEAAAEDAADLAGRVARGAAKLFRTGVYVTVHARTLDELAEACAGIRSAASSVLLDLQPATFRHHHGLTTTLPVGVDRLGMRRVLDTDALAAAFPFASADPPAPAPGQAPDASTAVLYGVNTASAGVLMWDRWAQDNHNSVVLARSGAGKSYFVKLEILRSLYQGVAVTVIDPEDEYAALAEHVGGRLIQLGRPGVRVNPLALPTTDRRPDTLTRRGLWLHTLVAVMLGEPPPPEQRAALDRAITATYRTAGITADPASWDQPPPCLGDLAAALGRDRDPAGAALAARLHAWTHGSFGTLFDHPEQQDHPGREPVAPAADPAADPDLGPGSGAGPGPGVAALTVWSLRHLPDEVHAVGTLLALDAIWRQIDAPTLETGAGAGAGAGAAAGPVRARARRQLVVVDEAWLLLVGEGARFLFRMSKAARKRAAGLCVVTQDAADVLGSDLGMAVVSNAATQVLMCQAPQAIDAVQAAFNLTAGEARLLLNVPRGEGLLLAGTTRIPFRAVASPQEDAVCRTGIHADYTHPGLVRRSGDDR